MHVIKPPSPLLPKDRQFKIFLAGSIEMGVAEEWQHKIETALKPYGGIIYNPRRDAWDSSWKQSPEEPKFVEQVEWELDALDDSDLIAMYLQAGTKSPISMMELGLHAPSSFFHKLFRRPSRLIVYCPEGFWKKGNVDIVCKRHRLETVESFDEFINAIERRVK